MDNHYYYGPYGWYGGGAYMYNEAWDDYYDHREDAREDWMDHREDVMENRGDVARDRQEQVTERQQTEARLQELFGKAVAWALTRPAAQPPEPVVASPEETR